MDVFVLVFEDGCERTEAEYRKHLNIRQDFPNLVMQSVTESFYSDCRL